jgi:hypothetical protein
MVAMRDPGGPTLLKPGLCGLWTEPGLEQCVTVHRMWSTRWVTAGRSVYDVQQRRAGAGGKQGSAGRMGVNSGR